jgi:hypothetical protein
MTPSSLSKVHIAFPKGFVMLAGEAFWPTHVSMAGEVLFNIQPAAYLIIIIKRLSGGGLRSLQIRVQGIIIQ